MRSQAHCRVLLWLLIILCILNILDFLATTSLVVNGEHLEFNPFMNLLLDTPYFALYKLVFIPLCLLFLWLVRKAVVPKYLGLVKFTCGVYTILILYTWFVFYS